MQSRHSKYIVRLTHLSALAAMLSIAPWAKSAEAPLPKSDIAVEAKDPEHPNVPSSVAIDSTPQSVEATKDVVLDTPASQPVQVAQFRTPLHDAATATALADLGLAVLKAHAEASGNAQVNRVLSPYSIANALALAHAGAAGETRREIASLMSSRAAGDQFFLQGLPALFTAVKMKSSNGIASANRLWVAKSVVPALTTTFTSTVQERYGAEGSVVDFKQPSQARATINQWVADRTAGHIGSLLAEGAVSSNTRLVLTNAVFFKSAWQTPFETRQTRPAPFHVADGKAISVPTMHDTRSVRQGVVDNITVYELPFTGDFSLLIGLPPKGHSLDALQKDLTGVDIASWPSQLKGKTCVLSLPRWKIELPPLSLKTTLQNLGVSTAFSPTADFSAALGKVGKGVQLDDALHAATIEINETGGLASAATAITAISKSMAPADPPDHCAVDRPFLFAIMHRSTGAPIFFGTVAQPTI